MLCYHFMIIQVHNNSNNISMNGKESEWSIKTHFDCVEWMSATHFSIYRWMLIELALWQYATMRGKWRLKGFSVEGLWLDLVLHQFSIGGITIATDVKRVIASSVEFGVRHCAAMLDAICSKVKIVCTYTLL